MKDIQNQEDIKLLVDTFYDTINKDSQLSVIFNEVAKVDWEHHLEKMYRFWETMLLNEMSYKGSAFKVHEKLPVSKEHFQQWIALFEKTINENFQGPVADDAIKTANNIALTFQAKLGLLK